MCCRYYMELSPELRPFVEAANRSPLRESLVAKLARPLVTEGEVRPGNLVPVVAPSRSRQATVYPMLWGFTGRTSPLFNARSETADSKPTFRESWVKRRCAIPASWYYEWAHAETPEGKRKTGERYAIQPVGCRVLFLAGLYRMEERDGQPCPVFTVLTREATPELRRIHDRMPVILPREALRRWIDPATDPAALLPLALEEMVVTQ